MGMAQTNDRILLRAIMTGNDGVIDSVNQECEDRPGIYCIFNSESKMLYIGCSNNVRTRIVTHKRHMANGNHVCKQMAADYIKNQDSFVFFPVEYVDFDDYESIELHRSTLLNRETQYMKRVPHIRLYNNNIPVSLSEKLLIADTPAESIKVAVSDIFSRLDMSPDSIRANGFSIQDKLPLPDAIEFVRKRTVANGRWPKEKADAAIAYLSELESKTKPFDSDSDYALMSNSEFDYFGDYVVKKSRWKTPSISEARTFLFGLVSIAVIVGHGFLIWQEAAELYGYIGAVGGFVVFLVVCLAVLLASDSSKNRTSEYALYFMFFVDSAAGFVHFEALSRPDVPQAMTIGFCIFICACSWVALLLYRDSKQD